MTAVVLIAIVVGFFYLTSGPSHLRINEVQQTAIEDLFILSRNRKLTEGDWDTFFKALPLSEEDIMAIKQNTVDRLLYKIY